MRRFLAILDARNKEFLRDRAALGWNILFPVLVVAGFAFAFSGGSRELFKVGLIGPSAFRGTEHIQFVEQPTIAPALELLRRHQIDMVLEGERYWISSSSPKGYLVERVLWGSDPEAAKVFSRQTVDGREIRYVDWLISGLLAMNMMFSALFGVGYTLVRYRKNGFLRRLKATPLGAFEFLAAQVASRLILLVAVTSFVYAGCHVFVRFQMLGSYRDLAVVMVTGAACLISVGLLLACRGSSEEFAGGVLNLISWPMMFLSGVWFSLEGAHPWVKAAAQALPLTHVIDAARAIMTEGATLAQVSGNLAVLSGMTAACLGLGALAFKWE